MTTLMMIGTAVSKTMRNKEGGKGGAEDIDHPDHKIKLNIASHPPHSNQCWKGFQSKLWINQNGSIVMDLSSSCCCWLWVKKSAAATIIFFLLCSPFSAHWIWIRKPTLTLVLPLSTVNCDRCALWTVNLNVCRTIKGRYFTTWADNCDNCYTEPAVWIRPSKLQFSLGLEINFCNFFLGWSGIILWATVGTSAKTGSHLGVLEIV